MDHVRYVGHDLVFADDHDVVVGKQRDDSSTFIGFTIENDGARLRDPRGATSDDGVSTVDLRSGLRAR